LFAEPAREPDKIERAKKISRLNYGLPWWLREAHFWRESKGENKEKTGSTNPTTTSAVRGAADGSFAE
jgi:hypothetical protein